MKTLASCAPSEFLRQVNRIKHSAERWLTLTDILNIRQKRPALTLIPKTATDEEREKLELANRARVKAQVMENLSEMFDAICDQHPDETLELLALCCFVEPENVDDHTVGEYLTAVSELVSDEAVIGFFTSLARLNAMRLTAVSEA